MFWLFHHGLASKHKHTGNLSCDTIIKSTGMSEIVANTLMIFRAYQSETPKKISSELEAQLWLPYQIHGCKLQPKFSTWTNMQFSQHILILLSLNITDTNAYILLWCRILHILILLFKISDWGMFPSLPYSAEWITVLTNTFNTFKHDQICRQKAYETAASVTHWYRVTLHLTSLSISQYI